MCCFFLSSLLLIPFFSTVFLFPTEVMQEYEQYHTTYQDFKISHLGIESANHMITETINFYKLCESLLNLQYREVTVLHIFSKIEFMENKSKTIFINQNSKFYISFAHCTLWHFLFIT